MKIQFGLGRRCVNPEIPISLAGYFNRRPWDHVKDDLEVRVVVFKSGADLAGIINFDLLSMPIGFYEAIREELVNAGITELDENNLLICTTHTHTGPMTQGDPNSEKYIRFAAKKAAEAMSDALKTFEDGELLTGMAQDIRFIFNRRYWMKNGTVVTNPGKLNPDILRPEGEIDPQIPMLAIRTDAGLKFLLSSIVNHTDTLGGCGVSADWPGFVRRELEPEMAPGAMVMQFVGASGNINHFDVSTDMDQTCYAEPERIGKGYAESIRKVWNDLTPVAGEGIKTACAHVQSKKRELSREEVEQARAIVNKYPDLDTSALGKEIALTSEDLAKGAPIVLKFFAERLLVIAEGIPDPHFLLTGMRFGDSTMIASLPSEPFVEIGLNVRRTIFNDKICLIASHGNFNGGKGFGGGYIPNSWNYGRGGYESTPRSSSYSIHTSEILLAAWRELAKKF